MASSPPSTIRFGHYEIDPARSELRRKGQPVDIEPQVFDLIALLAAHPGRVLSRDEIIESVWGGRIVSDSAVSTRINAARRALEDDGKAQNVIKTVSRRGFIFLPETQTEPAASPPVAAQGRAAPAVESARPSIVVLPFENLSNDPAQSFFSDGIADDIITDLSRYSELFVIARQSAFAYHARSATPFDFATELGVAYMLEGSVRRAEGRVRVTVQLVDVETGKTLWAERFNRDVTDILDVQEEIATVIVNTLVGQVAMLHHKRVQTTGADMVGAYDHALKAQQSIWSFSRDGCARTKEEARAAIRLAPDLARAHAMLGWAYHTEASNGWSEEPETPFDAALKHAKAAVAADPNEPWGHCVLGFTLWWRDRGRDFGRGLEEIRHAIRLNPSNAHFRMILGATYAYMGRGEEALTEINTAIRFNPLYPGLYLIHRARAHFVSGLYNEALSDCERAAIAMPGHANVLGLLAACYQILGKHDLAAATVADLRRTSPDFTLGYIRRVLPFSNPDDRDQLCTCLADAGMPDA